MKTTFLKLAAVAILATTASLSAQNAQTKGAKQQTQREPKTSEEIAKGMADRMTKNLELSTEQSQSLYNTYLKQIEQRKQLMAELKQLQDKQTKEVVALLNEDQLAEYLQSMQKNKGKKGPRVGAKKSHRSPQARQANTRGQRHRRPQAQCSKQCAQQPSTAGITLDE